MKYYGIGKFVIAEMQEDGTLQEIVCTVSATSFPGERAVEIRNKLLQLMNENEEFFKDETNDDNNS